MRMADENEDMSELVDELLDKIKTQEVELLESRELPPSNNMSFMGEDNDMDPSMMGTSNPKGMTGLDGMALQNYN